MKRMTLNRKDREIEGALKGLIGLKLFKSWNVFATRMFYFVGPGFENTTDDGDYRLTLECPWRIEQADRILVGNEDYGLRSDSNSDPTWDPGEAQWGHRQDQRLEEILGESKNGAIFNTGTQLVVESVTCDALGGFQLHLSGDFMLSVFPASAATMEWMLSSRTRGNLALMNGELSQRLTNG